MGMWISMPAFSLPFALLCSEGHSDRPVDTKCYRSSTKWRRTVLTLEQGCQTHFHGGPQQPRRLPSKGRMSFQDCINVTTPSQLSESSVGAATG